MTSEEFQKQYKGLNASQKEAVDTIEGAVMVVAGPGTGKTKTLTLRIANILLKTQVNPENILALTFTESAAHEMRTRLLSIIGHDAYRVDIMTFHSFCNSFIKRHQEEFGHIISSENINEIDQLEIIDRCIKTLSLQILRPLGNPDYYIKPAMHMINKLKQENVTPMEFEEGLNEFEKELKSRSDLYHEKGAHKGKMKSVYTKQLKDLEKNRELLKVYDLYQQKLIDEKKYDYNDMLLEVIKKLQEHEYLLQYLQEKYIYFLVDENQDTNASQNKIVELVANYFENPNLFIVGDEKQAIFRFQGANLSNFINFRKRYSDAKFINLKDNYRSTKNILDATYNLISNNPKNEKLLSDDKSLKKNTDYKEEKIVVAALPSVDAEHLYVGDKIKQLLKDTPAHEIAVLVRNNRDIEPFISVFDHMRIPYVVEADNDILEDLDVQKQILLLKAVANQNNLNIERVLLLDCFGIKPLDVFKINRYAFDEKINVWDIMTNKKILDNLEILDRRLIDDFVELFMGEDGFVKNSANFRFDVLFVDILNRSGLMTKIISKSNGQEILTRLTRLYDEVKKQVTRNPNLTVVDFVKYIELLQAHEISLKSNSSIVPKNSVRLMTVHKSKGQEFDFVFITNAYDTHWGNKHNRGVNFQIPWEHLIDSSVKEEVIDDNADERRLFYVAMTRARKNIIITYSILTADGKEQIPSQFITEIPLQYVFIDDAVKDGKEFEKSQKWLLKSKKIDQNNFTTREYTAELFRRQGLSVTALNNYLLCPWKFFFVNLIRLPEKINNSGLFGSAIHGALNQYLVQIKKGKKPDQKFLLSKFKEEMDLMPFNDNDKNAFFVRGEKALSGFYKERMQDWNRDMETELDIKGIRISDDLIINGKIDMVVPRENSKFDIVDFKTGKVKSRNVIEGKVKDGDGNYKRQLVFYKILLDRYRNGFFKMNTGVIEFVEPSESGAYKREIFDITNDESEALLKETLRVVDEIINLSFWDKKCEDKECEYCKLRTYLN